MNILSKEVGYSLSFDTPLVFLGILYYTLSSIILRIDFGNRKLTHFLQFWKEMNFDSNNVILVAPAQVTTLIVAQVLVMPIVVPISISHEEKSEKFNRLNFKRSQQKMLFYLTTLNLTKFLTKDASNLKEDEHKIQVISVVEAWKHFDFLCRNYVMNALIDSLYNVYSYKKTIKEL